MIAPLAKFIDRSVLQIGYAMLPQSIWREAANERDLKLEQAVQFLNGPDFIPAESQPAQLDFMPDASGGRFRFPTPRHRAALARSGLGVYQVSPRVTLGHIATLR